MAKIFKQQQNVNNHVKRNNFDLSFQNHLTMKMGVLYPVFCKEVVPGDSFRINAAFGLKFMPLAFPVQSRMRANMKFFYVRNKNLWKGWENWISGLKTSADGTDYVHPYILQTNNFFKTGTLCDYLGVPTTLAASGPAFATQYASTLTRISSIHYLHSGNTDSYTAQAFGEPVPDTNTVVSTSGFPASGLIPMSSTNPSNIALDNLLAPWASAARYGVLNGFTSRRLAKLSSPSHNNLIVEFGGNMPIDSSNLPAVKLSIATRPVGSSDAWNNIQVRTIVIGGSGSGIVVNGSRVVIPLSDNYVDIWNSYISNGQECAFLFTFTYTFKGSFEFYVCNDMWCHWDAADVKQDDFTTPFSTNASSANAIHISALPFRAYESIYHAYYRNTVNQPFMLNGEELFNQYNTTTAGGADGTAYHLFKHNYELDFLTSAMPSPQQGNAPLVGFNAITGTLTIEDEDGITTAVADVDGDGNITGLNVTSPFANKEHALTAAMIANAGMSINDFRNTNALQRWLETNIRKGYRYLDFIAGHFGKSPEYRELDMPEFIGGFSRDVNVSQIVSTADTLGNGGQSLGSFAGIANCFGGSNHSITHYCDDYGFIVGILTVVPTPAYSQLLPKHYLKYNPLDYYFPEFSSLGMQPISYEEVCPIQAYAESLADNTKSVRDTFGYQRPNYDLVNFVDEVHGQFRGDLHSFLINRVFGNRPVLGNDFLQIDPDETNQIFADTAVGDDNIIGQVIFDVKAKRPVPRVVIPSLGR